MQVVLSILALLVVLSYLFFWGRGLLRSQKDDMILGFSILSFICLVSIAFSDTSAVFSGIGILIFFFGLETLIVSPFVKQDCLINRKDRISLGVVSLVVGLLASMII